MRLQNVEFYTDVSLNWMIDFNSCSSNWDCYLIMMKDKKWDKIAECRILNWCELKLKDWSWQLQLKLRLLSDYDER